MDPAKFLDLANRLICSTDEAKRRTAISRAYYYVYHYIKQDLVGADGRNVRRLTHHLSSDWDPTWFDPFAPYSVSPAGKHAVRWGWLKQVTR